MLNTLIKHDLKALQAFVAIVECQGVTAAQDRLNMSQSAISTHLAHLEENLGVSLCRRGRSGFALTKAGHQLYEACTQLLQATGEFHREVQNIKWHRSVLSGTLRIGFAEDLPAFFLEAAGKPVAAAYRNYPDLRLAADVLPPQETEAAVAANRMDVGIGYFDSRLKNLRYQPLFDERQNVYCGAGHPAATAQTLTARALEEDYVWVKRTYARVPAGSGVNAGVTTATAERQEGALLFVLGGTHLAFLSEHLAAPFVEKGLLVPLLAGQASYRQTWCAVTRQTPDPRVNWFLGQLGDVLP